MDENAKIAAKIMREWRPKTMGDLFGIARGMALAENELSALLDDGSDCENGRAWAVVDAHYANLKNPEYRAAAGLGPTT